MTKHPRFNVIAWPVRRVATLACFSLGCISAAQAAVNVGDVQLGGFFSQGYLKSTNNNYPAAETKDGTGDFREMGLNASKTFGSHLRVGGQIFAQTLGDYGDNKVILDWAVVDYNFRPEIGIRAGRVKYPRSLHSEILDLDIVRPFVLLPQSIYDSRLRDYQASFDGGMIYGTLTAGKNSFDYKVFGGDIPIKNDSGLADYFNASSIFAAPPGVQSVNMDSVKGAALIWNTPLSGLRVGLFYSTIAHLKVQGPFRVIPTRTAEIDLEKSEYETLSTEYTTGPWTFTGEYLLQKGDLRVALPVGPVTRNRFGARNYYVSVARKLGAKFEVGTYYAETRNAYPGATTTSSNKSRRDWALALRYDYNDHLLFKIEGHSIRGTRDIFNVPGTSNPPNAIKDSMTLFAAKTTISF